MADFVSFNEFVDRTASAKVEHHRETIAAGLYRRPPRGGNFLTAEAGSVSADDDTIEEEFAKMKKYVLNLYKDVGNVQTQHTFLDAGGNFIDCIKLEQQPSFRAAKKAGINVTIKAPPPTRAAEVNVGAVTFGPMAPPMLPHLRRGLVDPFGKLMTCPDGRVPLRRTTLAQMANLGRFERFFRKYPAAPPFAGTIGVTEIHRHAVCGDTGGGNYYGCSTWLNIWQVDPSPGVFNLSQLWLIAPYGDGTTVQTIESGWQRSSVWGTDAPVLFIFYNPDSYQRGGQNGYVNGPNMMGFIQTNCDWIILGAMPPPYSSPDGDQFGWQMQWEIDDAGNWWLYIGSGDQDPVALGNFPAGAYGSGPLAQSARLVQFGGEVCSQPPGAPSYPATGKMGSGLPPFANPADSFGEVAFQKQIQVKMDPGGSMVPASLQVQSDPRDANYAAAASSSSGWGSFMFFGGPNG
jgi:hypothetical protein